MTKKLTKIRYINALINNYIESIIVLKINKIERSTFLIKLFILPLMFSRFSIDFKSLKILSISLDLKA